MPYDPDGRHGKEEYRLVTSLASMPPLPIFGNEEPSVAELVALGSEDNVQHSTGPTTSDGGEVANRGEIRAEGTSDGQSQLRKCDSQLVHLRTNGF